MKHLNLTFAGVELTAAAGGVDESGGEGRTISGQIVPYNTVAEIGYLGRVEFAPGSLELAARVPMLLGHDQNRPVGVLSKTADSEAALYGTFKIDQTGDGDSALAQAASGSRGGLSVGCDVIEFESLEQGELTRVTKAKISETSLVSLAAYDTAAVDAVAAAKPTRGGDVETETSTETSTETTEVDERPNRAPIVKVVAEAEPPKMRLGEYVQTLIKAERGDAVSRARIEAALTRETVANNPGVVPIAYVSEIVDGLGDARPLHDAFSTAPMPPAGMTIRRPQVTTRPNGGFLADDTAGAPSNAVVIGNLDVPVVQWAWGGSASVALVERSAPSYIEEVFTQVIKDYHRDTEAAIAAKLVAVAAGSGTTLGSAIAEYLTTTRQYPNVIVAGADAYGSIIDALGALRYAGGSADAQGSASLAGLQVVPSADVTSADAWVTHRDFIETRETAPIRLSVSDVNSLSLEVGVTSFWAAAADLIPGGAVRIAAFVPPVERAASSKK